MKAFGRILSILVGIVISMSGAAMLISGSTSLDAFYDVGFVCDYPDTQYCNIVRESGQSDSNGRIQVEGGDYEIYLSSLGTINNKDKKGNYLYMDISKMNREHINIIVELYKKDMSIPPVLCEEYKLIEGKNFLDISGNSFKGIRILVNGQEKTEFILNNVQVCEKKLFYSSKKFWIDFVCIFFVYCIVCVILKICAKPFRGMKRFGNLYLIIEILQNVYINVGENLYSLVPDHVIKRRKSITTLIFCIMMLYMTVMDNIKLYDKYYKYHMLFYAVALIAVAVINCSGRLSRMDWKSPLAFSWLLFWITVCLSDFKVTKQCQFLGYIGIFVLGFVVFVMNNEKRQVIIRSFKDAIHIYYLLCLSFCVLFRPYTAGVRYLGFSWNPGIFAICLVTVLAVTLGEIDNYILGYMGKRKVFIHVLELGSVCCLIFLSQAAGPLLAAVMIMMIWLVRCKCLSIVHIKDLCIMISGIVLATAMIYCGVKYVPLMVGHDIVMERDLYQASADIDSVLTVEAASVKSTLKNSRLYGKFEGLSLTKILSERNYYYKAYIRQMNLWGHFDKASAFGVKKLPHNALIGIAFRYGVFAWVPYFCMFAYAIVNLFVAIFENKENSFLAFSVCFTGVIMSMADNVEYPFMWCTWLGIYLMIGTVFKRNSHENSSKYRGVEGEQI